MTFPTPLREIAERLERATENHYTLDRLLEVATGQADELSGTHAVRKGHAYYQPKSYTASIDAAFALVNRVLPDWRVEIDTGDPSVKYTPPRARLIPVNTNDAGWALGIFDAKAATPAIALCIALVRALIAQQEKEPKP